MSVKEKENDQTCGTCNYYHTKDCPFYIYNGYWLPDSAICSDWSDPDEADLTDDEKYDGGVMSNFDNENPKEVEDYIE